MTEIRPPPSDRPTARVGALLANWRARLRYPILLVVALLASGYVALTYDHFQENGQRVAALAAVALLAVLWVCALLPTRFSAVGTGLALAVLYGAAILSLVTTGLGAGGMMAIFGYVALTALLLGARPGGYAFGLSTLTMATVAVGFNTGFLPAPNPKLLDATELQNWLRVGLFGVVVLAALGGVSASLLQEFVACLEERGTLVTRLRTEGLEHERARVALADTQTRLVHSHHFEAVGRLAGGIAHDFNNTLTLILSYAELTKKHLAVDSAGRDMAEHIIHAAEQGSDLTRQLLSFSRRHVVKPRNVSVEPIVRRTERVLARLVPRSIAVHCAADTEELCVRIDPTQLEQALLNLALNARDAMPDGGELHLDLQALTLTDADGIPVPPGPYVVLRVRDTGTGMSPEIQAQIFEPFFTTKEPGRGTGLGLANVRDATEAAGGHVSVQSVPGRGTEISLYLPRAANRVSSVEELADKGPSTQASILVVEGDPQIRSVVQTMLSDSGYNVHVAEGPKHAVEMARSRDFDLLWADLVMPESAGDALIEQLLLVQPSMPVLACSAHGTDPQVSTRIARGELVFLAKPFTQLALIDAVERALKRGRDARGGQAAPPPRVAG